MKRVLKRLKEVRIGASPIPIGTMVIFAKNEEAWRGRVSEAGTLRNGKPVYYVKNAVSDSGKEQTLNVDGKEIIKDITDMEMERGYGFYDNSYF
jgi:hypothetical protein